MPRICALVFAASYTNQSKQSLSQKKQTLIVYQQVFGKISAFDLSLNKLSSKKSIFMHSTVPLRFGLNININAKLKITAKTSSKCKIEEKVRVRAPLFYHVFGRRVWPETVGMAIKKSAENA